MERLSRVKRDDGSGSAHPPRLAVFSFFSGSGFMDLGFEKAGMEVVSAMDINRWFCRAYKHSREQMGLPQPRFECKNGNLLEIDKGELSGQMKALRDEQKLVGFIGGPPCPDFSVGGKNKGGEGDNGQLTGAFFDLIHAVRPDFFVFENVKGLMSTKRHREYYEAQKQKLADAYAMTDKVVDCLEMGVPQERKRLLLFGVLSERLHGGSHETLKTQIQKFWGSLPFPDASQNVEWPTQDEYEENSNRQSPNLEQYSALTVEHWFIQNDVENHANSGHFFKPKSMHRFNTVCEGDVARKCWKRLHRWRYSCTAAYGNNEVHLHPYKSRRLSAAEALAIQSLPKEFELPPTMPLSYMFKTIGNGLPFVAAQHIASRVRDFLEVTCTAAHHHKKRRTE